MKMKAFMTFDSHLILIKESNVDSTCCAEKSNVLILLVLLV